MLPIRGLFEVAIHVKQLARSETFYREVLGLEVGFRDEVRRWLFLRAGGQAGMLVLLEGEQEIRPQHFAFAIDGAELDRAAESLRAQGIVVDGPMIHAWMPAKSIYFADPDGHELELCASLATAPSTPA